MTLDDQAMLIIGVVILALVVAIFVLFLWPGYYELDRRSRAAERRSHRRQRPLGRIDRFRIAMRVRRDAAQAIATPPPLGADLAALFLDADAEALIAAFPDLDAHLEDVLAEHDADWKETQ